MKILVTGGAGFIGSNFLRLYVPRLPQHEFINIDALTYAANLGNLQGIDHRENYRFEHVDITDMNAVQQTFDRYQPGMVIHFAAESHVDRSIHGPRAFLKTNVEGTFNLLEAFRTLPEASQVLFHHVSTDEVFGSLGPEGLFHETTPYDPSSPYSASKASSDHLVRAYARTYGIPVKVTNCSNNYGPYQFPEKLIPLMILNARDGKPLPVYGKGINIRDWLYVEDHCEAIWAVIEKGALGRTYNIGGHNEITNIEVVKSICSLVAEQTDRPRGQLESLITYVTDRPGHDMRYAMDASRITAECGWSPRQTFETGLRETVRWYLDNSDWVDKVQSGSYREWMDQNYAARNTGETA